MISKEIPIPIYQSTVIVLIDPDLQYISQKFDAPHLKDYGAVTLKDPNDFRTYVVAFDNSRDDGLIVHETIHLVNMIYKDCGIALDVDNDENQAYFTAWLFDEIQSFIKSVL